MKTAIKAVLFDLDGTLIDTANDIAAALNRLLLVRAQQPLPFLQIRDIVSFGYRGMLKLAFDMAPEHADYNALKEEFNLYYHENVCTETNFFPGMEIVLNYLEKNNLPWGIVTNKPQAFTTKIVAQLPLLQKARCVVSGDTLANAKPHPEPILHACKLLAVAPENCLYIGDASVDIQASRAAGTFVLGALYGYIPSEENPQHWNADGYIQQPEDILQWLP